MRKGSFILLLIGIFSIANVYSQRIDSTKSNPLWVEVGIGVFSPTGELAFGQSYWVNYSDKNTVYKIRYQDIEEFSVLGPDPREFTKSFAFMMGKKLGNDIVHIAASGGLGLSTGISRGKYLYTNFGFLGSDVYERKSFQKVSIPLEIDLVFKPIKYLGMGIALTGDINAERSSYGVLWKVGVGLFM